MNWDTQRQIWDHIYRNLMSIKPSEHDLIITEPPFNFPSIMDAMCEVLFEDYGFSSLCVTLPASLSALNQLETHPEKPCCLVVDCGYSFTHIVPCYQGKPLFDSIVRIDVGGKTLTNHFKDVTSYRQLNVMDETYVMNQIKEDMCFVSQDLYSDIRTARQRRSDNTIIREYILPDFTTIKKGRICEEGSVPASDEQVLRLNNERFSIPEILFNPSDIGINQMGIPEAIVHSISTTPSQMHPYLYSNILLTGGSTKFPGFYERVLTEVRKLAPDSFQVNVSHSEQPDWTPWLGGQKLAEGSEKGEHLQRITQAEYKESGLNLCRKQFHENQVIMPN